MRTHSVPSSGREVTGERRNVAATKLVLTRFVSMPMRRRGH